ncbi:MAG: fibronectin type III domain-containing protein [Acidobacteria bacterium]|nr:fibronectin type III domain-containing protein [Acidobacteriota bacterium]
MASVPTAQAQQLLSLVSGVAEAASVDDPGPSIGPVPTAVQVDLDLLRSAPARLEVSTSDGSVLSAERSVFEDRGGGDLMWSGGQPEAGYDTVVLTVEGGRLVGRFGAAGGGVYQIHAEQDGRGGMVPVVGPQPDSPVPFCGVEAGAEHLHDGAVHVAARALAADLPERVSNPQSHDRLDILVAYTATAAENWADRGGALAAIRHAGDYLKMVFRNNNLPVEPHIVHVAQASAALDRLGRDLRVPNLQLQPLYSGNLWHLRHEHLADVVHLFTGEGPQLLGSCGASGQLLEGDTARQSFSVATGWTSTRCDYAATFAHEVAHGLGAHHEPAGVRLYADKTVTPYAFGHVNFDVMPSLGTVMSTQGQREPFYSTPRIRPYGVVAGIADEQDNERTLHQTVHLGVRYSDYLRSVEGVPLPPSDLRVRLEGESARLTWKGNTSDADGYVVWYQGGNLATEWHGTATEFRVEGSTEAATRLEYREPGTVYLFDVRATKGEEQSFNSHWVGLAIPDELEAPSDVSVTALSNAAEIHWTDNSDNERGFVVLILEDGEPVARKWAWADTTSALVPFRRPQEREYQARVFASNLSAYSEGSEAVTFRWTHPLAPAAVTDVAVSAIAPTTARVTWTGNAESDYYHVEARLRGWSHTVRTETEWVEIEGLARGGRYTFEVTAANRDGGSVPSWAYLTLGGRGTGPQAPSSLSWAPEDEEGHWARVSWEDNSRDELGFEVQAGGRRLVTVPPDTESVLISSGFLAPGFGGVRVYAYNERGFSPRSNRVSSGPGLEGLTATAGDTEVRLRWDMWAAEAVTRMQARWKATADLPFDDAVDTWTGLAASARAYKVTGLKNGTKYTFAVRFVTASGAGPEETARATPRAPPAPPRVPPEASFTSSVDCSDDPCRVGIGEEIRFTDTSTGDVTERHWSFGDGTTSDLKSPTHAWSTPGFHDVTLTVSNGSTSDSATRTVLVEAAVPAGFCRFDAETLCLQDSRFEVKANWWSANGESGSGRVVYAGTNDSGLFRFFGAENWEILIKVLDGCGINGRMWVLGAATTDLGYGIVVTDTVTGESRSYENEPGRPAPAIVDTEAFSLPCGDAGP